MGAVSNRELVEQMVEKALNRQGLGETFGYAVSFRTETPQPGVRVVVWEFTFTLASGLLGRGPHGYIGSIPGDLPAEAQVTAMVADAVKVLLAVRAAHMTGTAQRNGHAPSLLQGG